MTVNGGGNGDEGTRVDREPPSFPRVGDSSSSNANPQNSGPAFFASPASPQTAETSNIVTKPTDKTKGSGGSRLRWLAAGLATILVFVVVGGVLVLAAPRAGAASLVAHYAPADTAAYMEARLDFPGDQ